jgi:hypothetical protein
MTDTVTEVEMAFKTKSHGWVPVDTIVNIDVQERENPPHQALHAVVLTVAHGSWTMIDVYSTHDTAAEAERYAALLALRVWPTKYV